MSRVLNLLSYTAINWLGGPPHLWYQDLAANQAKVWQGYKWLSLPSCLEECFQLCRPLKSVWWEKALVPVQKLYAHWISFWCMLPPYIFPSLHTYNIAISERRATKHGHEAGVGAAYFCLPWQCLQVHWFISIDFIHCRDRILMMSTKILKR